MSSGSAHIKQTLLLLIVLLAQSLSPALGQRASPFPGSPVDAATLRIQERVEELFEAGDYQRAHFIYRHELAPVGDKYAQYMVGYMYLTGKGVAEDPLQASAWYRLAAERAQPQFIAVRDDLLQSFSEIDRLRSDDLYLELRREYSDAVLLINLIRNDLEQMSSRTGSRLPSGASPVTIIDPRAGIGVSADEYYRRIRQRIEMRLRFLAQQLGDDSIVVRAEDVDVDALDARVRDFVATLPAR